MRSSLFMILVWCGSLVSGFPGPGEMEVNIIVPSPMREGDDLKLICQFVKPQNVTIYSVKWYKGQREIFSYVPSVRESKRSNPIGTLDIDDVHSDMNTLMLKRVPSFMTGNISCEVTFDEPVYKSITKIAPLLVVAVPREKIIMVTSKGLPSRSPVQLKYYQPLLINCTTPPSKPAVNLSFVLNEKTITSDDPGIGLTFHRMIISNESEIQRGELELNLLPIHFQEGSIKISCVGNLYNLYIINSEEFVGELPRQEISSFSPSLTASTAITSIILLILLTTVFIQDHRE